MKSLWMLSLVPCVVLGLQACKTTGAEAAHERVRRSGQHQAHATMAENKAELKQAHNATERDTDSEAERDISSKNLEEALDRLESEIRK